MSKKSLVYFVLVLVFGATGAVGFFLYLPQWGMLAESVLMVGVLGFLFFLFDAWVMKSVATEEELKKGNVAYAIFMLAVAVLFLAVAVLVG